MAEGASPSRLFWALFAASVIAVGAVAFIVGAFVVNSRETVRERTKVREVVEVPPPGILSAEVSLPKPDGPPPRDEAKAREEVVRAVEVASAGTSTAADREASIEDGEGQDALRQQILLYFPELPVDEITARVDEVRFLNRTTAAVRYTIVIPGYAPSEIPDRIARVVSVGGTWKVTRESACNDLRLGGVMCPPLNGVSG